MTNETARMIQDAIEQDLGAKFSLLEIKGMTPITQSAIDEEMYVLVDSEGMAFLATLIADYPGGKPHNVLVKDVSMRKVSFEIRKKK